MGDSGDAWRDYKKERQEKKAQNVINSTARLTDKEIKFESLNGGVHLVIETTTGKIDFWPSTGRWMSRLVGGRHGRGIRSLLYYVEERKKLTQTID